MKSVVVLGFFFAAAAWAVFTVACWREYRRTFMKEAKP